MLQNESYSREVCVLKNESYFGDVVSAYGSIVQCRLVEHCNLARMKHVSEKRREDG